jgi:antitoxin ParD1/3/4
MATYHIIPIFGIGGAVMPKNTSMTLGDHFDGFIAQQIAEGRYASASEVVRAGLRMLEDNENRLVMLRRLLDEGENSGTAHYSYEGLMQELDDELG